MEEPALSNIASQTISLCQTSAARAPSQRVLLHLMSSQSLVSLPKLLCLHVPDPRASGQRPLNHGCKASCFPAIPRAQSRSMLAETQVLVPEILRRTSPSRRLGGLRLKDVWSLMLLRVTRDISVRLAALQMHRPMQVDVIESVHWVQVALAAHLPSPSSAFRLYQGRVSTCLQHCPCRLHPWTSRCPCASRAHSKLAIAVKPVT